MKKLYLIFFIVISIVTVEAKIQKPIITVWNYYLAPPFQTSLNQGLSEDIVTLLNQELGNYFTFRLEHVPRARLNTYLKQNLQGIILFVNPIWMGENAKTKYLWTPSFLNDQNEIISSMDKKIVYTNPNSLKGLKFVAIRGRKYKELEELFDRKKIQRIDITRERQSLQMIIRNRADITSQPRTVVLSLMQDLNIKDKIFLSPNPLFSFTRHIMVTPRLKDVHSHLSDFVENLKENHKWQSILNKYGLNEK